jgi:precorrin-6Y C5,15-methyltransferase (decarboxylating)
MNAWLDIVGIGEDGMAGLKPAARELLERAEIIIGGDRHHLLSDKVKAQRVSWPSPFDAMIDTIRSFRGRRVVVLVTGDPLWYSVGARIAKAIPAAEIRYHPQLSSFQFAAARMGWSLADVETLTIHGRPAEQIVPYFEPGARLLVLTKDASSPATVARMLADRGYGPSRLTALVALGGNAEGRVEGVAATWNAVVPDFHLLAVECVAGDNPQILPRAGLPDEVFEHDGKMTKRAARALAIAKLVPVRNGLLWDIGCGAGSIAIEWMRAAKEARAIGIEPDAKRRAFAGKNAIALGAPALKLVDGRAPPALVGLPAPDAVFLGGGIGEDTIAAALAALKPHGRIVAHAVTLESEAVLLAAMRRHGGELVRLNFESAQPVGSFLGWKPAMPVVQWSFAKGAI